MDPHIRFFADRLEGLQHQFLELKGFATRVPPLISAEWDRQWQEAAAQSDENRETIDIYENAAGAEQGWGFAKFDRAVYGAALNLGWDSFVGFLQEELLIYLAWRFRENDRSSKIVKVEQRKIREFPSLTARYEHWLHIDVSGRWPNLTEVRLSRNAIVHNFGCYTEEYLALPNHRMPDPNLAFSKEPDDLRDQELIPLDEQYVCGILDELSIVAGVVRAHILRAAPSGEEWILSDRWSRMS